MTFAVIASAQTRPAALQSSGEVSWVHFWGSHKRERRLGIPQRLCIRGCWSFEVGVGNFKVAPVGSVGRLAG